ncbi:MAG TPA: thioredoxin family protein [Candidatus Eisenbacteria bacterium]|jgi:tetratricopeptide (TPR) repeat protein
MRAFVFTDRSLARQAGQFVWLEIDTEKARNAALSARLKVRALPTFFVLDPATEAVVLRWVGGATAPQLEKLLEDGRLAVASAGSATPGGHRAPASAADSAFARAERLYGEDDNAAAADAYQEALRLAPDGWPHYGRAVESLLFAWQNTDDYEPAARLARDAWPRLRKTSSAANVVASGLDCALSLPDDHPLRRELMKTFEAGARELIADPAVPLAADDRSAVYIVLLDARKDAKDSTGARRVASEWAAFLEGEAARAVTPEERAVFDPHRLSAYLELGEPERAIPMLEASERDFPDDYNPPARLALAYKAMKRWDQALAASDRALVGVYGPRKLRLLEARAEIYVGRADRAAARRTLEEAVALAESFAPGQRSESAIASLKKKLGALP